MATIVTVEQVRQLWDKEIREIAGHTADDVAALASQPDEGDVDDDGRPSPEFLAAITDHLNSEVHEAEAAALVAALDIPFGPNLGEKAEPYDFPNDLPGWHRVGRHIPSRDGYYPDHGETEYRAPSGTVYTIHNYDPQRPAKVADHIRVLTVVDTYSNQVDVCWSATDTRLAAIYQQTDPKTVRGQNADRRALAVLEAVEAHGHGGVREVARVLGVTVGQVDQYLARARKISLDK